MKTLGVLAVLAVLTVGVAAAQSGSELGNMKTSGATFAEGIERLLTDIRSAGSTDSPMSAQKSRADTLDMMARLVGALVLSRACPDDSPLADEILEACRETALGRKQKGKWVAHSQVHQATD